MGRSSIVCAASGSEILSTREERDRAIRALAGHGTILAFSLILPGAAKRRRDLGYLARRAAGRLAEAIPDLRLASATSDALGPFRLWLAGGGAVSLKRAAVRVEEDDPLGRLYDIDVYDSAARPVDRARLWLPPRPCLLCGEPARECIWMRRHDLRALEEAVDALIDRSL